MALTRPLKEGSVTTYQAKVAAGFPDILASEMDADLDTIYAAWNGGITTANISDGSITTAKLAPNLQTWQTGAGNPITPIDATKQVTVPGPPAASADNAQVVLGSRTQKGRVMALPGQDFVGMSLNRRYNGTAWSRDDTAQPSWTAALTAASFSLGYETAAGVGGNPFYVLTADGKTYCTLANASVTQPMVAAGVALRQTVATTFRYAALTNIGVTAHPGVVILRTAITTTGGCVVLQVYAGGSLYPAVTGPAYVVLRLTRNGTGIGDYVFEAEIPANSTAHGFPVVLRASVLDAVAAGAYTYELNAFVASASNVYRTGRTNTGELYASELL